MSLKAIISASALVAARLVAGHAAIVRATGDAGGDGMALGIKSDTPRDGTRRNPFQQDSTRFRGQSADSFGETVGEGANSVKAGTSAIMAETGDQLPQISPGGEVQMTLHQVNADGGGPYKCMINSDGTGQTWQDIEVTQNIPGNRRGRNRDGNASDQPLTAAIPADQQCTGTVAGESNICMVRCQNPARAGPFGGVVPVQMGGAGNATAGAAEGNATAGAAGGADKNAAGGADKNAAAGADKNATGDKATGADTNATGDKAAGAVTKATGGKAAAASKTSTAAADTGAATGNSRAGRAGRAGRDRQQGAAGRGAAGRGAAGRGAAADDDEEEEEGANAKRAAFVKRIDDRTRVVAFKA